MIKRYVRNVSLGIPVFFVSNTNTGSTITENDYTTIVQGAPHAIVTYKVTAFSDNGGAATYSVDGTPYVLNDTFTRTLDGTGADTFSQVIDVGDNIGGDNASATLDIIATTIGRLGSPLSVNVSKTVAGNLFINNGSGNAISFVSGSGGSSFSYGPFAIGVSISYAIPTGTYTINVKLEPGPGANVDVNGNSGPVSGGGSVTNPGLTLPIFVTVT